MPTALPPRPRRRTWPQRLVLSAGCVIASVCLGTAAVAGYIGVRYGQIDRISELSLQEREAGEPANFLLVGTDSREGIDPDAPDAGGLLGEGGCECTDTIMVLRVDPDTHEAYILSFPRDLYLPISGQGETARINTAHSHGVQTLIDTIQDNFQIPINHYVEIDFVGFEKLVDAVGGVPMWFDTPVRDRHTGLDIPEDECQVLDGMQARQFVRSRYLQYQDEDGDWHDDVTADLGRITRQQVFVRRVVAKAVSEGLGNPVTLNRLVSAGVANVRLDELLDAGDLLSIGQEFADFDSDDLVTHSIPSESMTTSAGAKVELPLMREAQRPLNVFRGLPPGTVTPEGLELTVLNGTATEGQAANAAGALDTLGFGIAEVASYESSDVTRTTVFYPADDEAAGRRVAAHITGGTALVPSEDLEAGEVRLVIGADFTTVHDQPAPEGSREAALTTTSTEAGESTTTSSADSGPGSNGTTGPTTTTTDVGYATGEPPDGVDCA